MLVKGVDQGIGLADEVEGVTTEPDRPTTDEAPGPHRAGRVGLQVAGV